MHKFFVDPKYITGDTAIICGDDVKHIYKVLRLQPGEKVGINNTKGKEFLAEIQDVSKTQVTVNILEELATNNESPIEVYLFQGIPKSSKMDFIVQKCTELGVFKITPLITERVIVKNEIGEFKKVDRWQKIALEACKQSKRTIIPEIETPIDFKEFKARIKSMDLMIVPYENEKGTGIKNVINEIKEINEINKIKKVGIVIGPEGGFEEEEIYELISLGAKIVTLGPRIMRTETAGMVSLSLIMYELGDLGGEQR